MGLSLKALVVLFVSALLTVACLGVVYLIVSEAGDSNESCTCNEGGGVLSPSSTSVSVGEGKETPTSGEAQKMKSKKKKKMEEVRRRRGAKEDEKKALEEKARVEGERVKAEGEEKAAREEHQRLEKELFQLAEEKLRLENKHEQLLKQKKVNVGAYAITSVQCDFDEKSYIETDDATEIGEGVTDYEDLYLWNLTLEETCPKASLTVKSTGQMANTNPPIKYKHVVEKAKNNEEAHTYAIPVSKNRESEGGPYVTVDGDKVDRMEDSLRFLIQCISGFHFKLYDADKDTGSNYVDDYYGKFEWNEEEVKQCVATGKSSVKITSSAASEVYRHGSGKCFFTCTTSPINTPK
eukprot:Nk52_evm7s160 gene=Nk52_evmTU7s160